MHTTLSPVQRWDSLITVWFIFYQPTGSNLKLKSAKPVVRTVKRWTVEAEQDLLTDWTVFEAAATDLDELTDTVTCYISFCEDMCVPTRTYLTFNNDKPWFSTKLKQLCQAKEDAYMSGDKALYKQAKYTLNREITVAKKNYSEKLKTAFKERLYISLERPESQHQLQDPTPQHWGQLKTGWRPERVLWQVWNAKAWSDTPRPL